MANARKITDYRLSITDSRFPITDSRLPIPDCLEILVSIPFMERVSVLLIYVISRLNCPGDQHYTCL